MFNNHEKSNHEKNNTELPPMAPAMPYLFKPLWLKELKGGEEYCIRVETVKRNFDCSDGIKCYLKSLLSLWERARVRAELPKVEVFYLVYNI
jgi:hypothetical protein